MQNIGIHSIEDCLEVLTGLQKHNLEFKIDPSDATIMNSIARQIFRGTALTDRQYNLMKEKLTKYKDQFESQDVIGFDHAIERLRRPLREIDRSKYIKIVKDDEEKPLKDFEKNVKWIKIRFPFSKKDIVKIDKIAVKARKQYHHQKGSHEHFFVLNELNVYLIMKEFENKEFIIDDEIKDIYKECSIIKDDFKNYYAYYENNKFFNLNNFQKEYIRKNNLSEDQIIDRKNLLGYEVNIDRPHNYTLLDNVIFRSENDVCIKPSLYNVSDIVKAIIDLDRFPLLVVLDEEKAQDQILEIYDNFNYVVDTKNQCVLFRQEGKTEFNDFVKSKKLNNWLDKDTKIVYISNNNLPKLLIKENFNPLACFVFDNPLNTFVATYIRSKCDLVLNYAEVLSPYRNRLMYGRYV